ncbi:F-box/LRR-repeat protein 25-like [Papaver somniferum]|uniref:F-box/LRR-repeat protein 25-like n=1 Tax=Papaver somniferum TaxID=3469 RepID=UPI000E6FE250|nr:F-box/LRR-repeat protein 25-like [Papaver somniferum]
MVREAAKDRISDLPESLLHHIHSFLDIKDGARTCVISKRWNYIWTTAPILDLGTTFRRRHNSSTIDKFCISWSQLVSESGVHSWISTVLRGNVKELGLVFFPVYPSNCVFKIDAPGLVTFSYGGSVAKEFVLSNFPVLLKAAVNFTFEETGSAEEISRLLHALEGLIALLKAVPNLESLIIKENMKDKTELFSDEEDENDTAGDVDVDTAGYHESNSIDNEPVWHDS